MLQSMALWLTLLSWMELGVKVKVAAHSIRAHVHMHRSQFHNAVLSPIIQGLLLYYVLYSIKYNTVLYLYFVLLHPASTRFGEICSDMLTVSIEHSPIWMRFSGAENRTSGC